MAPKKTPPGTDAFNNTFTIDAQNELRRELAAMPVLTPEEQYAADMHAINGRQREYEAKPELVPVEIGDIDSKWVN